MVFVIVELKIEILWEHQLGSKDKKAEKIVRGAEGEQGVQFSWPPSTWLTRPLAGNAKVLQQINFGNTRPSCNDVSLGKNFYFHPFLSR